MFPVEKILLVNSIKKYKKKKFPAINLKVEIGF